MCGEALWECLANPDETTDVKSCFDLDEAVLNSNVPCVRLAIEVYTIFRDAIINYNRPTFDENEPNPLTGWDHDICDEIVNANAD